MDYKEIKNKWNNSIKQQKKELSIDSFSKSVSSMPKTDDNFGKIFSSTSNNMTAALVGNENDYEYSYEEGYFKAFKILVDFCDKNPAADVDSLIMPIMFTARQYLEITLKNAIFNFKIASGIEFKIGKTNNHDFKVIYNEFTNLLKKSELNIIPDNVSKIIQEIYLLNEKSYEFRYPTSNNGSYNMPDMYSNALNKKVKNINLIYLTNYINEAYIYLSSFEDVFDGNYDFGVLDYNIYGNADIKILIRYLLTNKFCKKLKNKLKNNPKLVSKFLKSEIKDFLKERSGISSEESTERLINSLDIKEEVREEVKEIVKDHFYVYFSGEKYIEIYYEKENEKEILTLKTSNTIG